MTDLNTVATDSVALAEDVATMAPPTNIVSIAEDLARLNTTVGEIQKLLGDLKSVDIAGESVAEMFGSVSVWAEKISGGKI